MTVIVTFQRAIEWQLTPPGAADGQFRCDELTMEVPGEAAVKAARTLADPVAAGVDAAGVSAVPVLSNGSHPCAWSGVAVTVTVPPTATQKARELSVDGTTRFFGQPEPLEPPEPAVPEPDGAGVVTIGGADAPGDDPVDAAELQAASPARASPANIMEPVQRWVVTARDFIWGNAVIAIRRVLRSRRFHSRAPALVLPALVRQWAVCAAASAQLPYNCGG